MKIEDVRRAFAMPLTDPSFPRPPYRFYDREYVVIKYRTGPDALSAVVPEPPEIVEPVVNYGQVIPVRFEGCEDGYVHSMYLDDDAPIAGGREIWGFPKKLANPKISHEGDVVVGTLHYGSVLCAVGTMGYKHGITDSEPIPRAMYQPNFVLKIIPHVDGRSSRVCELVRYQLEDIALKGAWTSPAALDLHPYVLADFARLPVLEVMAASHFIAGLTPGLGEVVFDYLTERASAAEGVSFPSGQSRS